jgi:tRNA uridine 5-carboxymethylaminomethyl modification enzyme
MESTIISGEDVHPGGPDGEPSSQGLSGCLKEMGLDIFRLKTGTPPRIKKESIDFSKAEIQPGQDGELGLLFHNHEIHAAQRPASVLAYLHLPGDPQDHSG